MLKIWMKIQLFLSLVLASNFAVTVNRYSSECFFEMLKTGDRLEITFETQYTPGNVYEMDFKIHNPDGTLLHSVIQHKEAAFGFNAGATGKHTMCFFNLNSPYEKIVQFNFQGPDDRIHIDDLKDASSEEKSLTLELTNLSNDLLFMKDEFSYLSRRIKRHLETASSTNSRVFWWTFMQMLLLAAAVYFQITYLRRFFEKKRMI